jgi:uncharacterized metal-binding protein YceD (DUF177 family)
MLNEQISLKKWLESAQVFSGEFLEPNLPELLSIPCKSSPIYYDLALQQEDNKPFIQGTLTSELQLECPRCLEWFNFPWQDAFTAYPVNSLEEADQLPENAEPYLMSETDSIDLQHVIEEELILALAFPPMHAEDDCKGFAAIEKPIAPDNPFAILDTLLEKNNAAD